jgi:S-adenosylmethionine decarboxylase
LGTHVICSLYGISFSRLDNILAIQLAFDKAVATMGATVLNKFSHQFTPQGVTIVYALAESHISCHTFPEMGSVALDCYTCGSMDPKSGMQILIDYFKPIEIRLQELSR